MKWHLINVPGEDFANKLDIFVAAIIFWLPEGMSFAV